MQYLLRAVTPGLTSGQPGGQRTAARQHVSLVSIPLHNSSEKSRQRTDLTSYNVRNIPPTPSNLYPGPESIIIINKCLVTDIHESAINRLFFLPR